MGPVGLVDPWVWWGCWSGGPGGTVGLVGPWVWWACVSGGPVGLVGPWVNFKGSDMPRCPWSSFYSTQLSTKVTPWKQPVVAIFCTSAIILASVKVFLGAISILS